MNGDGKNPGSLSTGLPLPIRVAQALVKNHKNWINFLTLKSMLLQKPKGKKRHRLGIIKNRDQITSISNKTPSHTCEQVEARAIKTQPPCDTPALLQLSSNHKVRLSSLR